MTEGSSAPHFCHQDVRAENLHHSFKVIGEDVEAHFCTDSFKGLGQQMRATHPELDGPEGVLHRLAPDTHAVGCVIQSVLHGLDSIFMRPSSDASFSAGSAFLLDRAMLAERTPVPVQLQAPFDGNVPPD